MSTRVSPQIKVVALVGVLLIAVAGSGLFILRRHQAAQSEVVTPPAPTKTATVHAPVRHDHETGAPTGLSQSAAAAIHGKLNTAPAPRLNHVNPLLPAPLRAQLALHRIVVVSAYDPQASVDGLSVAEARAGAQDAKVGFALVNVLDNKVAGRLTALLPSGDLLPSPGILVYRAPGRLVYRFDGYLDREAVAQAAANAKTGRDTAPAAETTAP